MKFKIKKEDSKKSNSEEITFDSLEIDDNILSKVQYLNNNQKKNRDVYSFTKSRSDFTSGGAKPYKQKGTGHARQGTKRSPLKVGGSVIFGPKPRVVTRKMNKQLKNDILKQLMLTKIDNSIILDGFDSVNKLSDVKAKFQSDKLYLILIDVNNDADVEFFNIVKNLPNLYFNNKCSICVEDLIRTDSIVYSTSAFDYYFGEKSW